VGKRNAADRADPAGERDRLPPARLADAVVPPPHRLPAAGTVGQQQGRARRAKELRGPAAEPSSRSLSTVRSIASQGAPCSRALQGIRAIIQSRAGRFKKISARSTAASGPGTDRASLAIGRRVPSPEAMPSCLPEA
jgi:hypothetical protein